VAVPIRKSFAQLFYVNQNFVLFAIAEDVLFLFASGVQYVPCHLLPSLSKEKKLNFLVILFIPDV
jgi:hypothetical protein